MRTSLPFNEKKNINYSLLSHDNLWSLHHCNTTWLIKQTSYRHTLHNTSFFHFKICLKKKIHARQKERPFSSTKWRLIFQSISFKIQSRQSVTVLRVPRLHQHQTPPLMWISGSQHFDTHCHKIPNTAGFYSWSAQPAQGHTRSFQSSPSPPQRHSLFCTVLSFSCGICFRMQILNPLIFSSLSLSLSTFSSLLCICPSIHPSVFSPCQPLHPLVIASRPDSLRPVSSAL